MKQGETAKCSNFRGANLTIATKQFEPFMFIHKEGKSVTATGGVDYQFVKLLSEAMNFQYTYIIPGDDKFGVLEDDNTWSGIIGLVQRQEADAGLGGLGIDFERSQAVNFTTPYEFERISFITKKSEEKPKIFAMIYPFTPTVWICLLAVLFIFVIFIYVREFFHVRMKGNNSPKMIRIVWYFYGSLIGKSGNLSVFKAPGVRLLLGIWWIATITILSFYSSLVISFITYPGFETQIDTFGRLMEAVNRHDLEVGSIIGSAPYSVIKKGKSSISRSLNESIRANETRNLVRSIPEGVKLVTERNYAFIFSKSALEVEVYENYPDKRLFISEDTMYTALGGMALSSSFKCCHIVNKYVKRFLSMGLFSKWKKDSIEAVHRPVSVTQDASSLTVTDLQGPFYLLLFGLMIALICFFIENLLILNMHKKHYILKRY